MRLVIRADASAEIGFGHVMRCVALAEVADDRDIPVTFTGEHADGADAAIRARGFELSPELEQSWPAGLRQGDVVVFDGYRFGPDDYEAVRAGGARVAAMDDSGNGDFPVDVLVNQNLPAAPQYNTLGTTQMLVGPRYALVRREFKEHRLQRGETGQPLLVTMGGSDSAGLTAPVVRICVEDGPFQQMIVLLGPLVSGADLPSNVEVVQDPDSVAGVFDRCDAAISAAGSTTWELLCVGMPCVLIGVAENQRHIGRPVGERGAALFAGGLPLDEHRLRRAIQSLNERRTRQHLSRRALELVDGRGGQRVLDVLLES